MANVKLKVLTPNQHEFIQDKDPKGFYDQSTHATLCDIIEKLKGFPKDCTRAESRLARIFRKAEPGLLLPEGMKSIGSLKSASSICVEGDHEGDITTEGMLIITEKGSLTGNVTAKSVFCKGKIVGEVRAHQKIKVYPTGMLIGDVEGITIQIETGAMVKGRCRLNPNLAENPEELLPQKKSVVGQLFGVGFLGLR